jgi:hypothetical protein
MKGNSVSDRLWRWYAKANAVVKTFTGPAQLGDGRAEADAVTSEYRCPLCSELMSDHNVERSHDQRTPTRVHCPV